jgi:hypothetical protein
MKGKSKRQREDGPPRPRPRPRPRTRPRPRPTSQPISQPEPLPPSSSIVLGTEYKRADQTWEIGGSNENLITIVDYHIRTFVLCVVPVSFLRSSGDNSWAYIFHVIGCCVENGHDGSVLDGDGNQHREDSREEPRAGVYLLRNAGELVLHSRGGLGCPLPRRGWRPFPALSEVRFL